MIVLRKADLQTVRKLRNLRIKKKRFFDEAKTFREANELIAKLSNEIKKTTDNDLIREKLKSEGVIL